MICDGGHAAVRATPVLLDHVHRALPAEDALARVACLGERRRNQRRLRDALLFDVFDVLQFTAHAPDQRRRHRRADRRVEVLDADGDVHGLAKSP